jgi:hypothetical protein
MYPLDPASVSGTTITADQLVNAPTRVNRFITDYLNLNRRRFILDIVSLRGGHPDVGDDDVRRLRLDQSLQPRQVGGRTHELQIRGGLDETYQAVPEQGVVLGQHDAGSHA